MREQQQRPLGRELAEARCVRLQPLRVSGAVAAIGPLVDGELPVRDDEPVAVLTYGLLKLHLALPFLHASARAETSALMRPELVAGTGLARPPRVVATFSLWRRADAMHDFAYHGAAHTAALEATRRRDFHRESLFARFRPYAATGDWGDLRPVARASSVPATAPFGG